MDQKKPRPIYRSKGVPLKVTRIYQIVGIVMGLAGILMLFLPLIADAPKSFIFLGLVYLVIAIFTPRWYSLLKRCRLYVFDDHIMGVSAFRFSANTTNPFAGRKVGNADVKFKFYLDEITNVEKGVAMHSQIVITANEQKHTVVVQNRDKAYNVLCDMVYGVQGARECVACGAPIGSTTETCPQCGQMTRYGHSLSEVKTDQKANSFFTVNNIIALAVGVVGLIILIPTLGDYQKIQTYGNLYIALYPAESKKILTKLLISGLMVAFAVISPLVDYLFKKLLKR